MVFDFDLLAAAFLQVPVDSHEGREPEAGFDYPEAEGTGIGQRFTIGEGYEPLKAKFPDQPAKSDYGEFQGHFSLEGADAGSQFSHLCIHLAAVVFRFRSSVQR